MPIDASTYAYSINRSLDPCIASPVGYYLWGTGPELIAGSVAFNYDSTHPCPNGATVSPETLVGKSILAPDPQTLVLRLSHPAAYFPAALTYPTAWPQPKQLIERYGMDTYDQATGTLHRGWTDHLAGFGGNLFTVKHWDHTGHFDVVRNEAFWGPKPKLREIDVTLYKDADSMFVDYSRNRQGDYLSSPSPDRLLTASSMPGFHQDPYPAILFLILDWRMPPFDDMRVRQAFDLALDRTANAHVLSHDSIIPSIHMVPQGMPGYNPRLSDPAGRVGEAALEPDIARAGALWQAYVRDRWGSDASKAPQVVYRYTAGSQASLAQATAYKRQWEAAMPGLQVTLYAFDYASFQHVRPSYHMTSIGWIMDYPDPQDFLSLLVRTGSAYNQSHISVPTADTLMDQADANPDPVQRLQQYQQAEQLLVNEVAWIPIGQLVNVYLVRPRVAGSYHERTSGVAALAIWQRIYVTTQAK